MRLTLTLTLLAGTVVTAQWLNYPTPGTPRTRDGKADLSAPAPRSGGKPDLSGIWQTEGTPREENERLLPGIGAITAPGDDPATISKYFFNLLVDFAPEQNPMRPEAAKLFQQRMEHPENATLRNPCLPLGVPMAGLIPAPYKIVQTPGLILILYEAVDNKFRQIYTDGRKLPPDPQPSWLGYSTGKWEGDALIVTTVGLNDRDGIDGLGHPRSEAARIIERFHRSNFGRMDVEITIDDPKNYTRSFTVKVTARLVPDSDILESVCAENEKDVVHLKQK
jgi:hypothetical protein